MNKTEAATILREEMRRRGRKGAAAQKKNVTAEQLSTWGKRGAAWAQDPKNRAKLKRWGRRGAKKRRSQNANS